MTESQKLSIKNTWYVKTSLLGLWFIKNIWVFINIILICIVGCIIFGIPIFGIDFGLYDLWRSGDPNAGNICSYVFGILAIASTSTFYFARSLKAIAATDIKSKKLKLCMIKCGVYFDKNGVIKNKLEKAIDMDIDNDGKIDKKTFEERLKEKPNIFKQFFICIEGLRTIIRLKIRNDVDVKDKVKKERRKIESFGKSQAVKTDNTETKKENIFAKYYHKFIVWITTTWHNFITNIKNIKTTFVTTRKTVGESIKQNKKLISKTEKKQMEIKTESPEISIVQEESPNIPEYSIEITETEDISDNTDIIEENNIEKSPEITETKKYHNNINNTPVVSVNNTKKSESIPQQKVIPQNTIISKRPNAVTRNQQKSLEDMLNKKRIR